jgi:hypothetical protein
MPARSAFDDFNSWLAAGGPSGVSTGDDLPDMERQAEVPMDQDAGAEAAPEAPPAAEVSEPDGPQPPAPFLAAIVVLPKGLQVYGKGWQQFKAIGYFSDGSQPDLTSSSKWWSMDPRLARLAGPGRVFFTGIPGSVMINVQHPQLAGGGQVCGTAVAVLPLQSKPPDQPEKPASDYAQGDLSTSDAASSVEGSVGGSASGVSGSTDTLSASASSSGGDVSGAASGTDVSDGLSASATVASRLDKE